MRLLATRLRRLSRFDSRARIRALTRFGLFLSLAGFKMKSVINIVVVIAFASALIMGTIALVDFIDRWATAAIGAF